MGHPAMASCATSFARAGPPCQRERLSPSIPYRALGAMPIERDASVFALDNEFPSTSPSRRDLFAAGALALLGANAVHCGVARAAVAAPTSRSGVPFVEVPLRRLELPRGGFGGAYVLLPICIGAFTGLFLLDSGLTANLITPETRDRLGISADEGFTAEGYTAGGLSSGRVVTLTDVSIASQRLRPLHALVSDFPQHRMPGGRDVAGMLGVEFMAQVDVDLDPAAKRVRFYKPGNARRVAKEEGLAAVPLAPLPSALLGAPVVFRPPGESGRPVVTSAILDTGSSFTAINIEAASESGLVGPGVAPPQGAEEIVGVGVDGRSIALPLVPAAEALLAPEEGGGQREVPLGGGRVALSDLAVFPGIFGERAAEEPHGLLGMDALGQRRVLISVRNLELYLG